MKYVPISVMIPDSHGDTLDLAVWEARRLIKSLRRALERHHARVYAEKRKSARAAKKTR
jgi:hypothetical protein